MSLIDVLSQNLWAMEAKRMFSMVNIVRRHAMGEQADAAVIEQASREHAVDALRDGRMSIAGMDGHRSDSGFVRFGQVAVVPVAGVIAKRASQVNGSSQPRGTATQSIERAIDAARADPLISSALLMVDSPGGGVMGVETLADKLRAIDADGFPVETFADDIMASAGLWIGSAARRVSINRAAEVGSIGVFAVLIDSSEAFKERGFAAYLITTGEFKGIGAAGVPVPEPHIEEMQREVNTVRDHFIDGLAAGRSNLSRAQIEALATGRVWFGEEAVSVGLADEVATLDAVVERMNSTYSSGSRAISRAASSGGQGMGREADPAVKSGTTESTTQPTAPTPAPAAGASPTVTISQADLSKMVGEAVASAAAEQGKQRMHNLQEIKAITDPFAHVEEVRTLAAAAVADALGCDVNKLRADVLKAVADNRRPSGSIVHVGEDGREQRKAAVEIGLLTRTMPGLESKLRAEGSRAGGEDEDDRKAAAERIARAIGYAGGAKDALKAIDEAKANGIMRETRLPRLVEACAHQAQAAGARVDFGSDESMFAAAIGHSTSDFPDMLSNLANKTLLAAYAEQQPRYRQLARVQSLSDFKEAPMLALSDAQDLLLVPEGGHPERADFDERKHTIMLDTYAREFVITRQMVRNDDLNAFSLTPRLFGIAARRVPDDLVFALINNNPKMSEGKTLFHADHNNLAASGTALGMTTLQTAWEAIEDQVGFGSSAPVLDLEPDRVAVPSNLRFKAEKLRRAEFDPDLETTGGGLTREPNVLRGMFSVVWNKRLKTASATAWYAMCDPNVAPALAVGFLDGREVPIIAEKPRTSAFEMGWEVIFDCGASAIAWEPIYKNPGA